MVSIRLKAFLGLSAVFLLWTGAGCSTAPRPVSDVADIEMLIEAGNASMNNGEYEEAIPYYRRALAMDMTDSEAFGNLSVAYYYLARYDEAIREALQAVILSPEEINWRLNLGASYTRKGDYEGAVRAYGAAVEIARGLADKNRFQLRNALIGLGRSCELAGLYDRALDAYREALVFSPDDTALLAGTGNIYFRQGRMDEAEALYHRTLAQDSTHAVARYNVALIYARSGRFDEAMELFADNPMVDRRLEGSLESSSVSAVDRSKTSSIEAYRARLERMGGPLPPTSRQSRKPPPYVYAMGLTYYEQGAENEAMVAFEQALEIDPGLAEAHLYIGNIFARQERHESAVEAYEKAVGIDSGFVEAYNNLGSVYAYTGRPEEAMEAYRKALSLNDRFYDARTNLGLLYAEAGRLKDAVDEYMMVIRAEVGIAEVHNNLGMVYLRQGRYEDARVQFQKAIGLRDDFPEAFNNLALTYGQEAGLDDIIDTWRGLAAKWAGHAPRSTAALGTLPLRRVPARSSAVGGEARSAYRRGVDAAFNHDLNDALAGFNDALSAQPEWPAAQLAQGTVLLAQGRWNASVKALASMVPPETPDPLPYAVLAIARISGGDYNAALEAWEQAALHAEGTDETAAREAGITMRSRAEAADRMLEALESAVALRPAFPTAQFNLGLVKDGLHQYEQAILNYGEVVRLAPDLAAGHFRLGIAFYRLGQGEKARTAIREYVRLASEPLLLPQVETFLNKSR